jgi:hypothetical protein
MPKRKLASRQVRPGPIDEPEPEAEESERLDPIIAGLLNHLPPPGDFWHPNDRKIWLDALTTALKLIYPEESDGTPNNPSGNL